MRKDLLTCLLLASAAAYGQYPDTDIYLADFKEKNNSCTLKKPVNITNRPGYDSQPSFLSDNNTILYSSHRDSQTDIYAFSIEDRKNRQITSTPESEFSPIEMQDGFFSSVLIERDSTQRLWKLGMNGEKPELLSTVDSIGYHCWIDKETLAVFMLTHPFSLHLLRLKSNKTTVVARNIGRCIQKIPGKEAVSFVEKVTDREWLLKKLDFSTREISTIARLPEGREDYAWTPAGTVLLGKDGKLFKLNPSADKEWVEVADLTKSGIKDFQRLAISKNGKKLALVTKMD